MTYVDAGVAFVPFLVCFKQLLQLPKNVILLISNEITIFCSLNQEYFLFRNLMRQCSPRFSTHLVMTDGDADK